MISKKRIITAAVTFFIVGGTGYVMQNGDALAARFSADEPVSMAVQPSLKLTGDALAANIPMPPTEAVSPRSLKTQEPVFLNRLVAFNTEIDTEELMELATPSFYPATCAVSLELLPTIGAMVQLDLTAPCYQNQRIEISHGGLEFADATSNEGAFSVMVPALFEYEPYTISFLDGRTVEAKTLMLSVDEYDRVALSWFGKQNLNIHGLEDGVEFGQPGHVWAMSANIPKPGQDVTGGFLIELGNPSLLAPRLAEVYSFPNLGDRNVSDIELIVEAEIDNTSCGTNLVGRSIQISTAGVTKTNDLSLAFPDCDGQNGYLVLKNLLQDLKIARN